MHRDCPHWGYGLLISYGPIMPVSGQVAVVLWPSIPKMSVQPAVDYYPISDLEIVR